MSNITYKLFVCFYTFLLYCTLAMQTTASLLPHDPTCNSRPAGADAGFQWRAGGKGAASPPCQSSADAAMAPSAAALLHGRVPHKGH